ncbi:hypothetical protein GGR54DRAFT_639005 [Hypoxylon sp. NC1633]|nr:hypothetical protein GGR54DRAFT_639005 [Hypoxylon sp. NC1633]
MATQPPPSKAPAPTQPQTQPNNNSNPYIHNVALGVTPIALIAMFLPPRRLDVRAVLLGGVALWGTNQLVYDYSGTSTAQRIGRRMSSLAGTELPDAAKETQARLRAERARIRLQQQQQQQQQQPRNAGGEAGLPEAQRKMVEEQRRSRGGGGEGAEGDKEKDRSLLEWVWMGDSSDDWKEKRDRREKEALSEGGGGYWGLITDQLSEVWNQGKKKDSNEKEAKGGSAEGESKKP